MVLINVEELPGVVPESLLSLIDREFPNFAELPPPTAAATTTTDTSAVNDDAETDVDLAVFGMELKTLAKVAASLRRARDAHAEVEKPLQQHLYAMHDAILKQYSHDAETLEGTCLTLLRSVLQQGREGENDEDPATLFFRVAEATLDVVRRVMEQKSQLEQLRAAEVVYSARGNEAKSLSPVFTAMQRRVEKMIEAAFTKDPQRLKSFRSPIEIQKLATRPYNPDEAFVRNLLLSRTSSLQFKPADIVTDICGVCSNVIEDYAKAKPRVHCVDCDNGHNSMCLPCAKVSRALSQLLYACGPASSSCSSSSGNKKKPPHWSNWFQSAFTTITTDVLMHAEHHLTGAVEHCMYCIHQDCSPAHAQIATVIDKGLLNFRGRPCFGLPFDPKDPTSLQDAGYPTLLGAIRGNGMNTDYRSITTSVLEAPIEDPQLVPPPEFRWVPAAQTLHLPTAFPTEEWRSPHSAIAAAGRQYASPRLDIMWLTFEHVDSLSAAVRAEVLRVTNAAGNPVFLSVRDSALWYVLEIGIIRARRNAAGVYPLWAPEDMASAIDLLFPNSSPNSKSDGAQKEEEEKVVVAAATPLDNGSSSIDELPPHLLVRKGGLAFIDEDVAKRLLLRDDANHQMALPERMVILCSGPATAAAALSAQLLSALRRKDGGRCYGGLLLCVVPLLDWLRTGQALTEESYHAVVEATTTTATSSTDPQTTTSGGEGLEEWERAFLATKPKPIEPDDKSIAAVTVFTSGTSGGRPKGVMTNAREWELECRRQFLGVCDSSLSAYAPCWATDKHNVWRAFLAGGRVTFHRPDRSVFDAARACGVTPAMSIVPFIGAQLEPMFESVANAEIQRMTNNNNNNNNNNNKPSSLLTATRIRSTAYATAAVYQLEELFGGRIFVMSLGGAMVRPELMSFLKRTVPCVVMENYGLTECGGVLRDNRPYPGSTIKLVDRPELGYLTTDVPYPRGEFAVKNDYIAKPSEWVCDATTRAALQSRYLPDGFFLTGDIGLQRPDGTYEVIDRASAVLKLSNGKFVSPERVEQAIGDGIGEIIRSQHPNDEEEGKAKTARDPNGGEERSLLISWLLRMTGCAVFPDPEKTCLVVFASFDAADDATSTSSTPISSAVLHRVFTEACLKRGVPLDEIPVATFLEVGHRWSCDNGLLTPSKKPNRKRVEERLRMVQQNEAARVGGEAPVAPSSTSSLREGRAAGNPIGDVRAVARRLRDAMHPTAAKTDDTLTVRLGLLGCDSLLLSRVPVIISTLLSELRCDVDRLQFEPRSIRDCSELPSTLFSVPSLLQHSFLLLAEKIWQPVPAASTRKVEGEEVESQPVVLMSRQSSTMVTAAEGSSLLEDLDLDGGRVAGDHRAPPHQLRNGEEPEQEEAPHPHAEHNNNNKNNNSNNNKTGNEANKDTTTLPDDSSKEQAYLLDAKKALLKEIRELEQYAATDLTQRSVAFIRSMMLDEDHTGSNGGARADAALPQQKSLPASQRPDAVIVTGAAGYLGASVVEQLLKTPLPSEAPPKKVVCLVRPKSGVDVRSRVWEALCRILGCDARTMMPEPWIPFRPTSDRAAYCRWMRAQFDEHCVVLPGDVQLPEFGISEFDASLGYHTSLLQPYHVTSIIHCAAEVKHWDLADGLSLLYDTNVTGCVNVAQLAMDCALHEKTAPDGLPVSETTAMLPTVVHVSTSSVCKGQCVTAVDEDADVWVALSDLPVGTFSTFDAYSGTKLMGENVLRQWRLQVQRAGARLVVVRPPLLTWHSESGAANHDDWLNRLIDTVLAMRLVPTAPGLVERTPFAPVDVCARRIAECAEPIIMGPSPNDSASPPPLPPVMCVVYPFETKDSGTLEAADASTLSMMSVLRVVQETVNTELVLHRPVGGGDDGEAVEWREEPHNDNYNDGLCIRSIPAYAWRVALASVAVSHPLPYHPLLGKGLLETQRAAGVRPVQPLTSSSAVAIAALLKVRDSEAWVDPLRRHLIKTIRASLVRPNK